LVLQDQQDKTHIATMAGFIALLTAPSVKLKTKTFILAIITLFFDFRLMILVER
jgi:hypothetical protein